MLNTLETKLSTLIGDTVSVRTHLTVVGGADFPDLDTGQGSVRVALQKLQQDHLSFDHDLKSFAGSSSEPTSVRTFNIDVMAAIEFRVRPNVTVPGNRPDLLESRQLILEDSSLVIHRLGADDVRNGKFFFNPSVDEGLLVRTFEFHEGAFDNQLNEGMLNGKLDYRVNADIWPPEGAMEEGVIEEVDVLMVSQPLRISPDLPVLSPGGTTNLRIPSLSGSRLINLEDQERETIELAVMVISELPQDARGTVTTGDPGNEAGVRIIEDTQPETVITYQAPAGDLGATRVEFVAVHLAKPNHDRGMFLGAGAIQLNSE